MNSPINKPRARVAVITRTKDRPVLLPRAMESILGQRYTDYLHVIVNDAGNQAQTEASITPYRERYGDKLLVVHKTHSTGMEGASNTGIDACDSEFILIHDDDDSLHPDFLLRMVEYLDAPYPIHNLGGVICHSMTVYEKIVGNGVQETERNPFNHWVTEVTLWRMCAGNFFPPIAFLFKRAALEQIGPFEEQLPVLGDWEFNLRMLEQFEIGVLPQALAYYHHRIQDANSASVYANSIIGGVNRHQFYHAYLKNEMLRRDLRGKTLGLGLLVNMNPQFERFVAMSYKAERAATPFLKAARLPRRGWSLLKRLWKH